MQRHKTTTRARYAETDASGIVYYNSYLLYFEKGRVEMFRQLGLAYDWRLPIAETYCRYRSPARFDDLLEIHTFVAELRSKGFRLGCEVYKIDEAGEAEPVLLAEGYTSMVTVGPDRRPVPLPEPYRRAFGSVATESPDDQA